VASLYMATSARDLRIHASKIIFEYTFAAYIKGGEGRFYSPVNALICVECKTAVIFANASDGQYSNEGLEQEGGGDSVVLRYLFVTDSSLPV